MRLIMIRFVLMRGSDMVKANSPGEPDAAGVFLQTGFRGRVNVWKNMVSCSSIANDPGLLFLVLSWNSQGHVS